MLIMFIAGFHRTLWINWCRSFSDYSLLVKVVQSASIGVFSSVLRV